MAPFTCNRIVLRVLVFPLKCTGFLLSLSLIYLSEKWARFRTYLKSLTYGVSSPSLNFILLNLKSQISNLNSYFSQLSTDSQLRLNSFHSGSLVPFILSLSRTSFPQAVSSERERLNKNLKQAGCLLPLASCLLLLTLNWPPCSLTFCFLDTAAWVVRWRMRRRIRWRWRRGRRGLRIRIH